MGKGSSAPAPSAEYQQYKSQYSAGTSVDIADYNKQVAELKAANPSVAYGPLATSSPKGVLYSTPKSGEVQIPIQAPQMMTEQQYYEDKYRRQQVAFEENTARMKAENEAAMAELDAKREAARLEQEAALKAKAEADLLATQTELRDKMLTDRDLAVTSSVDFVNTQMARERSNASLFGIEYNVDDATKKARVENYFSNIWGEEQEYNLTNLFDTIGKPEGLDTFDVNRSSTGFIDPRIKAKQEIVGKSRGVAKNARAGTSIISSDEQPLGGNTSILGGAANG